MLLEGNGEECGREWMKEKWEITGDGEGTEEEKEGDPHPVYRPLQLSSRGCAYTSAYCRSSSGVWGSSP